MEEKPLSFTYMYTNQYRLNGHGYPHAFSMNGIYSVVSCNKVKINNNIT